MIIENHQRTKKNTQKNFHEYFCDFVSITYDRFYKHCEKEKLEEIAKNLFIDRLDLKENRPNLEKILLEPLEWELYYYSKDFVENIMYANTRKYDSSTRDIIRKDIEYYLQQFKQEFTEKISQILLNGKDVAKITLHKQSEDDKTPRVIIERFGKIIVEWSFTRDRELKGYYADGYFFNQKVKGEFLSKDREKAIDVYNNLIVNA